MFRTLEQLLTRESPNDQNQHIEFGSEFQCKAGKSSACLFAAESSRPFRYTSEAPESSQELEQRKFAGSVQCKGPIPGTSELCSQCMELEQ